jgi:hypothetical protein
LTARDALQALCEAAQKAGRKKWAALPKKKGALYEKKGSRRKKTKKKRLLSAPFRRVGRVGGVDGLLLFCYAFAILQKTKILKKITKKIAISEAAIEKKI